MAGNETTSREALRDFLSLIEEVDRDFLSEERRVTEAADVAEGEHMLLHLVKAALDVWVDNDAARPRFAPLASPVLKWGGEGADNRPIARPSTRPAATGSAGACRTRPCLLYTSPSPRDKRQSRMPSSA